MRRASESKDIPGKGRSSGRRKGPALVPLFFLVLLPSASLLQSSAAQEDRFEGWDRILSEAFVRNPDRQEIRVFRLPASEEAARLADQARAALKAGTFDRAVSHLDRLVTEYSDRVFQVGVESYRGSRGCARFVGAGAYARYLLHTLPPEGKAVYDAFVRERVGDRLARAEALRDLETLERIGNRFGPSYAGREAYRWLAEFHLERGEAALAEVFLRKVLLYAEGPEPGGALRLVQALHLQGRTEEARRFLERYVAAGGALREDGREDLERRLAKVPPLAAVRSNDWPTVGGDGTRARPMPCELSPEDFTYQWSKPFLDPRLAQFDPFGPLVRFTGWIPFYPLRAGEILVLNDSVSADAFNLHTGERIWHFKGPLEEQEGSKEFYDLEDYFAFGPRDSITTLSPYILAGGTVDGDLCFLNLQARRRRQLERTIDRQVINKAIPRRGLFAVGLEDGRLRWVHGDEAEEEDRFLGKVSLPAAPVVLGDRVLANGYVREGGINTCVLCFDRETGALRWKTPTGIGQQELTMFNMEYKEFVMPPLAAAGGAVLFCSNLGFVAALDALNGSILWITEYDTIPLPQANMLERIPRPRQVVWHDNPPLVWEGRVAVTPMDSRDLLVLDRYTGKVCWKKGYREIGEERYPDVLGVHAGKLILAGEGGAVALDMDAGARAWRVVMPAGERAAGRGAVTADRLVLLAVGEPPSSGGRRLYFYDLETGAPAGRVDLNLDLPPSALFLLGETAVATSFDSAFAFFNAPAMLARAQARLKRGEEGFENLAFMGDMYRLAGDYPRAAEFYGKALGASDAGTVPRTERSRVAASRFGALLEQGRSLRAEGRVPEAAAALRAALQATEHPEAFVKASLELLDLLEEEGDREGVAATLEALDRRAGAVSFSFDGREDLRNAPVGLFVQLHRYRRARAKGDGTASAAALQSVIERFPDAQWKGMPARTRAAALLSDLIRREGRVVYAAYDRKAEEAFRAALAEGRLALLERVAARFPNAEVAGRVALAIARRYLEGGGPEKVFHVLADFLSTHPEAEETPHALYLMASAAEAEGNRALRNALYRRLVEQYEDLACPWKGGKSYGALLSAVPSPVPPAAPYLPQGECTVRTARFSMGELPRLAQVEGTPPPGMEGRVLLRLGDAGSLVLFDYKEMKKVWERDLTRYQSSPLREDLVRMAYAGPAVAAVFDTQAVGLAFSDGAVRWRFDAGGVVRDAAFAAGLLGVLYNPVEGEDYARHLELCVLDPVSGTLLWRKTLPYGVRARLAPSEDALCVLYPGLREAPQLRTFDPFTGRPWARVEAAAGEAFRALPFPCGPERVLVLKERAPEASGRSEGIRDLYAFDVHTGEAPFMVDLSEFQVRESSCLRTDRGGLVFLARRLRPLSGRKELVLVDPAEGRQAGTVPVTADEELLLDRGRVLPGPLLYLAATVGRRTLSLSAVDTTQGTYCFEDRRYRLGDNTTFDLQVRPVAFAADGVVVPMDFRPNRRGARGLAGQVLLVDARRGDLRYVLDLYAAPDARNRAFFSTRYRVETAVRPDAVLVVKFSTMYVIEGKPSGG